MAKYKYRQTGGGNSSSKYLWYINYNISPDFDNVIAPGDTVTISGEVCNTIDNIRSIEIRSGWSQSILHIYNMSVLKGRVGSFSISFNVTQDIIDGVTVKDPTGTYIYFKDLNQRFYKQDSAISFDLYSQPNGIYGDSSNGMGMNNSAFDSAQFLTFSKYRLAPRILAMDFKRATANGKWTDDGQYLQCEALKIAKNSQAVVGDFTKATITCTGSDGSSRSVKLTQAQLTAALTSGGYSETKPSIFANFVSALGVDYTLTLTLGDNYDQVKFTDTVMRSFARLHLSGGKNGGVAVGMFSSATNDKPKFEVADTHESFFYGGVKSFGAGDKCTESQRALGLQCGSYSLTVGAASTADVSITFPKAFAAVPTVLAHYTRTFDNVNHIGDEGVVCISATATQGKFRLCNASATSRTMTFNWFAIGQMSGAAVASFAAEPPKIVAEGICVDEALARTDYIAMMAGIEIPSDAEEELTVQSSPQQIESPSIDEPQLLHSEKFELVKLYYDAQVWNKSMVKVAVDKWITEDEYKEIINTK